MRTLLVGMAIALVAVPAYGQGMGSKRHHGQSAKTTEQKPKVDDKAYSSALSRIPVPEKKYDPWQSKR